MTTRRTVAEGSLTDGDCLVLVNASNTGLALGSGVSGAIRRACGAGYQEMLDRTLAERGGSLEPGEVIVTDAGAHPTARWVAHVAVMDYRGGGQVAPDAARLERGCRNLWRAIEAIEVLDLTVAMVALGAGVGGFELRTSVGIALRTLDEHLGETPGSRIAEVRFHGYTAAEAAAIRAEIDVSTGT